MASEHNISIDQGATFALAMVFRDASETPIDLATATVAAQIRPDAESKNIIANLTATKDAGTTGRVVLSLTASQTGQLAFESAAYDVLITFADGTAVRALQGNVALSKQVTR